MKNTIFFVAAGVLAWFYWAKSVAVTKLQFYVQDVDADFQDGAPIIRLNIAVQNPTNEAFVIDSVVGTLTANGQPIGQVSSYAQVPIPPVHASSYPVSVRISLVGMALSVYNLISQGIGTSQNIGFTGAINASGIVAPVDFNVKIG